jgi:hypothetical protein
VPSAQLPPVEPSATGPYRNGRPAELADPAADRPSWTDADPSGPGPHDDVALLRLGGAPRTRDTAPAAEPVVGPAAEPVWALDVSATVHAPPWRSETADRPAAAEAAADGADGADGADDWTLPIPVVPPRPEPVPAPAPAPVVDPLADAPWIAEARRVARAAQAAEQEAKRAAQRAAREQAAREYARERSAHGSADEHAGQHRPAHRRPQHGSGHPYPAGRGTPLDPPVTGSASAPPPVRARHSAERPEPFDEPSSGRHRRPER